MTPRVRRKPGAFVARSGPWKAVRTTVDVHDDLEDVLYDASNVFNPDPDNASGWYARPGMDLLNSGSPITTSAAQFRGQGIFYHTDFATGLTYNFIVMNGKLFRLDGTLTTATDVTPVGITIDANTTTRVFGTSFATQFVINDGVNRPWLATNLGTTPITGTYIDFDGAGTAWTAYGPFVVYGGSVFCILGSVGGVAARTDIAWSIAGDASTGWQQTDYDYRWTLLQTATQALYALAATNVALYYFRQQSVGAIAGAVGPDLQTTATHDQNAFNIGTQMPQCIVQYGDSLIYFTDALGRPYRFSPGKAPEPIWHELRGIIDASTIGVPGINRYVATAAFDPTLNLYVVAPFTSFASQGGPPTEAYTFDVRTGAYFGRFSVAGGIQMDCLGTLLDASGRGVLVVLGSLVAPTSTSVATSGYAWAMHALTGTGDSITTESSTLTFLTTEDGTFLTSEGIADAWTDGATVPTRYVQTGRMGFDIRMVLNVDRASVLVGNTSPCQVSMQTASMALTLEGTPTPSTVQDRVAQLQVGAGGIQGRGVEVKVAPTTATEQWSVQSLAVDAVLSLAGVDEP